MRYDNHCLPVLLVAAVLSVTACEGDEETNSDRPVADSEPATDRNPALLDPSLAKERAPDKFRARFSTTKGDFVIEVTRDWAPQGADRFYNLVKIGYFADEAFFRNIENFMVQFASTVTRRSTKSGTDRISRTTRSRSRISEDTSRLRRGRP